MARQKFQKEILLLAFRAGKLLLANGAEIFRVEDTVYRICRAYGLQSVRAFVLSSALFLTAGNETEPQFAEVWQIPVNAANLTRVAELNELSRHIELTHCSPEEIRAELDRIENMPDFPLWLQVLAGGVCGAAFSCMFEGDPADFACAFVIGLLFELYFTRIGQPHFSRIVRNILGGALIAALSILFCHSGLGHHLQSLMTGGIVLMVPGVAFTNGIRDLADGDYLSGEIRLLDALIVFFCIAIGVGSVMALYGWFTGGAPL
ncbi:MAG: threonine/serine exporter family protein [Clostridiales bacterium]|nr:threonine/serine exporter family protein [Clostridiales bacterium]